MTLQERRSYVRGAFSFKVNFRLLTPGEYQEIKEMGKQFGYPDEEIITDLTDQDKAGAEITLNACLIDFLLQMDEKLDQILTRLSKDEEDTGFLVKHGIGTNISGAGMNVMVEEPVELGQVIQAHFVLSRIPLIFVDTFGEVLRVAPVDENGTVTYNLGIEFLDLKHNDRERIIACVFQRERKSIRERKSHK